MDTGQVPRCPMRVHANTDGKVAASTTAAGFVTPQDAQDLDALDGLVGLANVVRRHYGRPLQVLLVIDDGDEADAFAVAA
jgi:hypothetical protein